MPAEAARAVAGDLDLIGTDEADWAARWWYRYAHYLSTPELKERICGCGCDKPEGIAIKEIMSSPGVYNREQAQEIFDDNWRGEKR